MKKTILIIEDETALLYALESQLSSEGFATITADDGEKALRLARQNIPDLIVLDIILPKIDGWKVLGTLKKDPATSAIPTVIISNLADEHSRDRGIKLGAKDYLAKIEYSVGDLVKKIKKLA